MPWRVFFVATGIISALLIAELWLRAREPFYPGEVHYVPHPYRGFSPKPGGVVELSNSLEPANPRDLGFALGPEGFRIDTIVATPNSGEFRIFVLGGSAVFNGAPSAMTIPAVIQEILREKGFDSAMVYNFGAVSYVSGQELSLLLHKLIDLRPDLVVVYDGANDFHQPLLHDPRPGFPMDFMINEYLRTDFRENPVASTFAALISQSRLITAIRGGEADDAWNQEDLRTRVGFRSEAWERKIVEQYLGNIAKMKLLASASGFRLAVFLQPTVHFKRPLTPREEGLLGNEEFQQYILRQYEGARIGGAKLASSDSYFAFVDLSNAFAGDSRQTFWDFVHVDNEGNRRVARRICDEIAAAGLISSKSAAAKR